MGSDCPVGSHQACGTRERFGFRLDEFPVCPKVGQGRRRSVRMRRYIQASLQHIQWSTGHDNIEGAPCKHPELP